MAEIIFETLKIEGFAGIQPLTIVKLNDPGLNVITGPNGATKTTRFSALCWVLYGKPLKANSSVLTWEHVRKPEYQGTMVSVSFTRLNSKYRVTRCKDYQGVIAGAKGSNRFIVERDGELAWPLLKDKRDIQPALVELLGFSHSLFINAIIFPQKVIRFIESKGPERKKLLEEPFKLLWINQAAKVAQGKKNEIQAKFNIAKATNQGIQDSLASLESMLITMAEAEEEFWANKAENEKNIVKKIETLELESKGKVESVEPLLKLEAKLNSSIDQIEKDPLYLDRSKIALDLNLKIPERNRLTQDLRSNSSALVVATSHRVVRCPECDQVLPRKDSREYISKLKLDQTNLQAKLVAIKPIIAKLSQKLIDADKLVADLGSYQKSLRGIGSDLVKARQTNLLIEGSKGRVQELNAQLTALKQQTYTDPSKPVHISIHKAKLSLKTSTTKLTKLAKKLDLYTWVIGGPLGANGIKAFMFEKLIELINHQLILMEAITSFGVSLVVEGSGVRKNIEAIVSRRGFPVAYADLSGGESNLVNVMISLAIGKIVTLEQPINIRIFDESFEGLDEENVGVVADLVSQMKQELSIFIITHKSTFNPQNCNRTVLERHD